MLVYYLLKVVILKTRIVCHFILVLLSSTLKKQLGCHVSIISFIHIFGLNIQWAWLVPIHRNWPLLCLLHNLFSGRTFEQVTLYSVWLHLVYCIGWVVCFWLSLIVQFISAFSLSRTEIRWVSTDDSVMSF